MEGTHLEDVTSLRETYTVLVPKTHPETRRSGFIQ